MFTRLTHMVNARTGASRSFPMQIISAFPGTGKSHFFKNPGDFEGLILDSDSSTFPKEHFPGNYIEHIQKSVAQQKLMLVSSHDAVRLALKEVNLPFVLIYPAIGLKDEYLERYKQRGSPEGFLKLMDQKWDDFVNSCSSCLSATHKIELKSGQYLSHVITPKVYWDF